MTVDEAVRSWKVKPFARGSADCCAFADHVVKELTGKSYIPAYATDEEAEAIIEQHGSLANAVTEWMGREPVPRDSLSPGDVVFLVVMEHDAIGILLSKDRAVTVFEDGIPRAVSFGFVDYGWQTWV